VQRIILPKKVLFWQGIYYLKTILSFYQIHTKNETLLSTPLLFELGIAHAASPKQL
jgi:hypothetical protein